MLSIGAYSTAPAACPQLSPARRALSSKPVERCDKQTDRETDAPYRFIDYAPHRPTYADSVNNRINRRLMSYDLRRRHYCHIYITFIHVGDTDCKVKAVACLKWLKELSKKH